MINTKLSENDKQTGEKMVYNHRGIKTEKREIRNRKGKYNFQADSNRKPVKF